MEAALSPHVRRPDVAGVVSHESALSIHGLSDVNPAHVHVTLPTAVRIRRQVQKGLVIHDADLASEDSNESRACRSRRPKGRSGTPTRATLATPSSPRRSPTDDGPEPC